VDGRPAGIDAAPSAGSPRSHAEESRVKGDLAKIVLYALSQVDHEAVDIQQTRKAGMDLSNPQLLHVGAEARLKLKE